MLTYVWFVGRQSGKVEFITAASNLFVMRALPNSHLGAEDPADFWTTCQPKDMEPFLNSDYEVWLYDTDSLPDKPRDGEIVDPENPVSSEFPPVQRWVMGRKVTRDFISKNSQLIGLGIEFTFKEVEAEFSGLKISPKPKLEEPARSKTDRVCPWCGVTAVRRYNFTRPYFEEESEMPSNMENPVLWTDGAWSESGVDPDCKNSIDNQYGDSVVSCPSCNALFLASVLEAHGSDEYQVSRAASEYVLPGRVEEGYFEKTLSEEWILSAQLDQTLDYLDQNLKDAGMISWSQWTAAQQIVNWVSYIIRTGDSITEEQDARGRRLLAELCKRFSQIQEGTLGFDYPFNNVLSEMYDENFFDHTHTLEERFPMANMRRIAGDWHEIYYTLGNNLFNIGSLEDLEKQGLHEFDEYIIRRRLLLKHLNENKDSRWAVHSGEITDK